MTSRAIQPLRSVLYLPASNSRAIEKARSLPADAVIFDLEDAVAPDAKPQARRNLEDAFATGAVAAGINVIRVNALDCEEFAEDLLTVGRCRPHAMLVPKVSHPDEVTSIWRSMDAAFGAAVPALWCMIETASGVQHAERIAVSAHGEGRAIDCLVIGTNDIARETGVSMGQDRQFMLPWLMTAVLAAKAHGLAILDGVWNDFGDTDGFAAEAMQGRMMGFDGKTLIHPTQVEPANRIFAPDAETVENARRIAAAFADPANAGKGVINMEGRMVELLHLEMAQRVLQKHEAIRSRAGAARDSDPH